MAVGQRIKIFLESKDLRQQEIADKLHMSRQNISSFITGRSEPKLKTVAQVLTIFPELNARWLLTGEGHMLEEQQMIKSEEDILTYLKSIKEDCDLCKEKDKQIRELERLVEAKDELIQELKKK